MDLESRCDPFTLGPEIDIPGNRARKFMHAIWKWMRGGHDGRRKVVELVVPIFSNKNPEYDSKTSGIKPGTNMRPGQAQEDIGNGRNLLPQGISGPWQRVCIF